MDGKNSAKPRNLLLLHRFWSRRTSTINAEQLERFADNYSLRWTKKKHTKLNVREEQIVSERRRRKKTTFAVLLAKLFSWKFLHSNDLNSKFNDTKIRSSAIIFLSFMLPVTTGVESSYKCIRRDNSNDRNCTQYKFDAATTTATSNRCSTLNLCLGICELRLELFK